MKDIATLLKQVVVIGGRLGLSAGLYWDSLESSARDCIGSGLDRDLPIVRAATGTSAGLVGGGSEGIYMKGCP